jgi:hypothetical protein
VPTRTRRWLGAALWPGVVRDADRSDDGFVQIVAWFLGCLQTLLNALFYSVPSRLVAERWNNGKPWLYFNYIYFVWWAAVIVGGFTLAAPRASGGWQFVLLGFALWRAAEILTWYIKLLFDKGHRVLIEVERNLLFLIGDSAILVTVLALLLETGHEDDLVKRWSDALSAFTLNGTPAKYESAWATAVGVVGAVGGVVLLGAGLGLLTGIVGERIDKAKGRTYTGPMRPPAPWHRKAE